MALHKLCLSSTTSSVENEGITRWSQTFAGRDHSLFYNDGSTWETFWLIVQRNFDAEREKNWLLRLQLWIGGVAIQMFFL